LSSWPVSGRSRPPAWPARWSRARWPPAPPRAHGRASGNTPGSPPPAARRRTAAVPSRLQHRPHARADRRGERPRAPVGQADAAVRLGLADVGRFGRAMDAVVLLRQVHPDYADRIVRAWLEGRLRMAGVGIPEQVRVVVEGRVAGNAVDLPFADRQRVVLAA